MDTFLSIIVLILFFAISIVYMRLLFREDKQIVEIKKRISVIFPEILDLYIRKGNKSKTTLKKDIYLKVYNDKGVPYDINTMVYVCIHEISHIICEVNDNNTNEQHSPEFYNIFDKIIGISIEKGIFNPSIPLDSDYINN